MKKNTNIKRKKAVKRRKNLVILLMFLLGVLVVALGVLVFSKQQGEKKAEEDETAFEFPYMLEKEEIQVDSLFPFTGSNVDCNYEEGEEIATLQITNKSERHLTKATFTVLMEDKTTYTFEVTDIPSGAFATVFEKDNKVLDIANVCKEITCDAQFEDEAPMMEDVLSVAVDGMNVVATNQSAEELTNVVLHCHIQLDDGIYGGLTYQYPVVSIQPGESVTVEATDCFLDSAKVVRISQDKEEQENGQASE